MRPRVTPGDGYNFIDGLRTGWATSAFIARLLRQESFAFFRIPARRASFEVERFPPPRRGSHKSAQGNALGTGTRRSPLPRKGQTGRSIPRVPRDSFFRECLREKPRNLKMLRPFRAGTDPIVDPSPGRCPGLICSAPSGQNPQCATSKRASEGSEALPSLARRAGMQFFRAGVIAIAFALGLSGCSKEIETYYGRRAGESVNGTGVFSNLLSDRRHEVRTAVRLTDELSLWADLIVRFAPQGGPPDREEAAWYAQWLNAAPGRRLIYVPHDYEAQFEYWDDVIAHFTAKTPRKVVDRAEIRRNNANRWSTFVAARPKQKADAESWFDVVPATGPPVVCKTLGGPWAIGIDAARAAIPCHEALKVDAETVLLTGDGKALAFEWTRFNGSNVLVVANGSFLLNAALVNRERRPLAMRVVRWAGDGPSKVAFVEGRFLTGKVASMPSAFDLLKVWPFGWVAAQLVVLGLAACLARAPRLGRPRPDPPSGADRPAAHPEALGALLAKTGQIREARQILEVYRRWRTQSPLARRLQPEPEPPPEAPSKPEAVAFE